MKKGLLCLVLTLLILAASSVLAGAPLAIESPETITPYQTTLVKGVCPSEGTLSLSLVDDRQMIDVVTERACAPGPFEWAVRGCFADDSPWPRGTYSLRWVWQPAGGETLTVEQPVRVAKPANYLQFALPQSDSLSLKALKPALRIDYQARGTGNLRIDTVSLEAPDTPIKSDSVPIADGQPKVYRWQPTVRGALLPKGRYKLVFTVDRSEQTPTVLTVSLTEDEPLDPNPLLGQTDSYLPASLDDEAVWQAMQSPLVVTTVGEGTRVLIREEPNINSQSLGFVRGGSAGVKVLGAADKGFIKVGAHRYGDGAYVEGYMPEKLLTRVAPGSRYGLLLNKKAQTITVYEAGKPIGTLGISTGLGYATKPQKTFETAEGAFVTTGRIGVFPSYGYWYEHAMHLDGGNLIHALGYRRYQGMKADYTEQTATIGQKASHGCVRVARESSDSELTAYWLYTHLPYHTKVLVVDDPSAESLYRQAQIEKEAQEAILPTEQPPAPNGPTQQEQTP